MNNIVLKNDCMGINTYNIIIRYVYMYYYYIYNNYLTFN